MTRTDTVLTAAEFLAAWDSLGLPEPPVELDLPVAGATLAELHRVRARTLDGLRARGLAGAGGPVPEVATTLRLLAHAPRTTDLRLSDGLVALGASAGAHGVLVVQHGGRLRLHGLDGSRVPPVVVGLVGPLRSGRARPVNIAADLLDDARRSVPGGAGHWDLADRLVERGVQRADANSLARMCTGITAAGQLGVTARVPGGERRGRWVIGFHRAAAGDFVQLRRPVGPAGDVVTIAPITAAGLLSHLGELEADLLAA